MCKIYLEFNIFETKISVSSDTPAAKGVSGIGWEVPRRKGKSGKAGNYVGSS